MVLHGKMTNKNRVRIVIQQDLLHNVVGVSKISDRLMTIKIDFVDEIIHIVCAYVPQIDLRKLIKSYFRKIWSI